MRRHCRKHLSYDDPKDAMTVTTARRTVPTLKAMAGANEKIAMLTCYDASFAALSDAAGVELCWWETRSAW